MDDFVIFVKSIPIFLMIVNFMNRKNSSQRNYNFLTVIKRKQNLVIVCSTQKVPLVSVSYEKLAIRIISKEY